MSVRYHTVGAIAVLTVDNPPVNALGHAVRLGLADGLQRARGDAAIAAVVIIGAGKTFFAGADIREFEKRFETPMVRDIQAGLEVFNKPVIAAIHGTAFGGGLEVALCCHWRVAVASALFGLPEIKLGLMPGAGGTQRLPRLIGIEPAFDIMYSGNPVDAAKAHELGIIDAIVETDLLAGAIAFAERVVAEQRPLRVVSADDSKVSAVDPELFAELRKRSAKKSRGTIAPEKIIESLEAACRLPVAQGLLFEHECFQACYDSPQHYAAQHLFFAERQARKVADVPATVKPLPIRSAAVIGAGNMGGGIAMCFANAGIPVILVDVSSEAAQRGLEVIRKNYAASVARGSLSEQKMAAALQSISTATDYGALKNVDIVIEAVFEDMQIKQQIFADLDRVVAPHTILASNTSTLDIDALAAATTRPAKVIGTHFFVPANVMKLLENVRGTQSSPETIATVMELGKRLGKVSVLAGNCDGFIGNRMWQFYTSEAEFLLEDGATPEQVDRAIESFGMPMGPFAMRDLSGNDIGLKVRKLREQKFAAHERFPKILERMVERGWLGQKVGKGFYVYEGRQRVANPEALLMIEQISKEMGIARRALSDEEILARLLHPLINEGAKALEDGISSRASDIDIVFVNGYGFPAYRGGPMYWAERIGLQKVLATAEQLGEKHGGRWQPAQLLRRLAANKQGWSD
jgi:3-hydroxyacyl-CoA dehydrogenase